MVNCAAYGCSKSSRTPGNSFFRFPLKNPALLKEWLVRIKRVNFKPNASTRICSNHFVKDCVQSHTEVDFLSSIGYGVKRSPHLKPDAVPTIFEYSGSSNNNSDENNKAKKPRGAYAKRRRREILTTVLEQANYVDEPPVTTTVTDQIGNLNANDGDCANEQLPLLTTVDKSSQCLVETRNTYSSTSVRTKSTFCQTDGKTRNIAVQTEESLVSKVEVSVQCEILKPNESLLNIVTKVPNGNAIKTVKERSSETDDFDHDDGKMDKDDDLFVPSTASESELMEIDNEIDPRSKNERKFLVFESCLFQLFAICTVCLSPSIPKITQILGSMIAIETECVNRHVKSWFSQPFIGKMPLGNLLSAASLLFSGSHPSTVVRMFEFLDIPYISLRTYFDIQRYYLFPSVILRWTTEESKMLKNYRDKDQRCNLGGDARCDSPGHNAKYGSYSLMDLDTSEVVTFQLIQRNEVSSSNAMEKEGLVRCLDVLQKENVFVNMLVTDRHLQIRKYLREEWPEIDHQFDPWHIVKSVTKKFTAAAKFKDCDILEKWIPAINNHLYWCASTSPGKPMEKLHKWLSVPNHVSNIHEKHPGTCYQSCEHRNMDDRPTGTKNKKWIPQGTLAHLHVTKIVNDTRLGNDIKMISSHGNTSALEGFHSQLLKLVPKNTHFFYDGMLSRLALAALHNNENCGRQQKKTKTGELQFKYVYSKSKKKSCQVAPIKEDATYTYALELMETVIERRISAPTYDAAKNLMEMEKPHVVPEPMTKQYERLPKKELIEKHIYRFNQ